jgi:DNA-binding SARP family transcriptional activator
VAIEYRVLGSLEALEDGRRLSLGGPRQRVLLAVLLLHANEVVPASRLIDDVWGEEPPETAANIVQGYVSDLRHVLGREAIATRGRGYAIYVEPGDLDLRRFERLVEAGIEALDDDRPREAGGILREALELWRGPALADLVDESFVSPAVGRLEELRLGVLERRIDSDLACGRHAEVVAELAALVAEHPLREWFRAQHILALYRSGRQADALESFRTARGILADELGIDPGPALQRLEQAILAQDPSLDLPEAGHHGFAERQSPQRVVLLVIRAGSAITALADLGEALVRQPGYELIVASLVPAEADLATETTRLNGTRATLADRGIAVRAAAFISTRPGEDVVRLASEQDVALTIVAAPPSLLRRGVPDPDLALVLAQAPCDVALIVTKPPGVEGPVVVPFGGADHDWAAVELGAWLARGRGAPLRLVGATAVPYAGKRDASRLLFHASLAVQRAVGVAAEPLLTSPGHEGILAASKDAGLLVVGLSDRWHLEGLGPARLALAMGARPPTLLVRRGQRPGGLAPREQLTRFTWSVAPTLG